jgi:hypothetical protein
MPHSEIIHPQAPPAREIHRADPASHDAEAVRALGEQFKRSAETLFQSFDLESSATALKNAAARSDQYASSLSRYWSYMRESAGDTYLHKNLVGKDWHADTTWFRETNSALREIDRTLSRQLSKWEEVTSPYADKLDAVAISHACHDLRFTIDEALQKTKPEGLPGDPQSTAEYAYRLTISVALAGMSEQIGKRLEALGSGTPQPASFTRQIRDFLERESGKDALGREIDAEAKEVDALRQEFFNSGFTAERLDQMRTRQVELIELLRDTGLRADRRNTLSLEKRKVDASLRAWAEGMKRVSMGNDRAQSLTDARAELDEAVKKLNQKLCDEDRDGWTEKRSERAEKLLKLETPLVKRAVDGVSDYAEAVRERGKQYKQSLDDARDTVSDKGVQNFWAKVKKRCLEETGVVSGNELSRDLDKAFDSGLSGQLGEWSKKSDGAGRIDGAELQRLASDISETIDSYTNRASYLMEANADLQSVNDQLNCGLLAIRESIDGRLKRLFEQGAFGSPFS